LLTTVNYCASALFSQNERIDPLSAASEFVFHVFCTIALLSVV